MVEGTGFSAAALIDTNQLVFDQCLESTARITFPGFESVQRVCVLYQCAKINKYVEVKLQLRCRLCRIFGALCV